MTNKTQNKLKIKLPQEVIVSLVRDDNHDYLGPFSTVLKGGDKNSYDLPYFTELFELCADQVKYLTSAYKKVSDKAYIVKLSGDKAKEYSIHRMHGFSTEGEVVPIKEITYQKESPLEEFALVDKSQLKSKQLEEMLGSCLQCAREALPN